MELITNRYENQIAGVLNCYDRIVLTGTLLNRCYSGGMELYLKIHKIRYFDFFDKLAHPLADEIKKQAHDIACEAGIEIEYLGRSTIRKESLVQEKLQQRGNSPGLVCILSNVERCRCYKAYHDKQKNQTGLKMRYGQCLTYYFYFIDEELGLCFLRVPTWLPCQLLFYFNGHNYLANQLSKEKIKFKTADNCFTEIGNFNRANELCSQIEPRKIEERINFYVSKCLPMLENKLESSYYWSLKQLELSTDIIFKRSKTLPSIYDALITTAMHTIKAPNIASFLGLNLPHKNIDNIGSNIKKTIEGIRLRHNLGPHSVKIYDKYNLVLRVETTTEKVNSFKTLRMVYGRDGNRSMKIASVKKSVRSLDVLFAIMSASNRRYIEFISSLETFSVGREKLKKATAKVKEKNRTYKGINFFDEDDDALLRIISAGEFNITGFRNQDLRKQLRKNTGQISRIIKRLHSHGLIKRIGKTYKYYLSKNGKDIVMTGLKLKELYVIPQLNFTVV